MPTTVKENKTVKISKEIIDVQNDIITIESIMSKVKHASTIEALTSIKSDLIHKTHDLSELRLNEGGNI